MNIAKTSSARLKIIAACIVAAVFILGVRLYLVQVVHGDEYSRRAEKQYVRPQQDIFDRGAIYMQDTEKNRFSAASLKSGYILAINPQLINDSERVYERLSSVVDIDQESFYLKAGKDDDPYEVIKERVAEEKRTKIQEMDLNGVSTYSQRWRYYPGGDLAARTIGFVGFSGDERTGQYGVEREYNGILKRSGKETYVNFFAQVFSSIKETIVNDPDKRAGDVVLTINPTAQSFLEDVLSRTKKEWNTNKSMGMIIDPETGAIHAMATRPSYNLNNYSQIDDPSLYSNPLVSDVYEMGSIIKPLTMAAGLDTDAVSADTMYTDEGEVTYNEATIANYDGEARGRVDMQAVLNESLNTGAAFVQQQIGNETFREYLYDFGLNNKTRIDLPNEAAPLLGNLDSPRDIEYVTAAFGQGMALNPTQTVRALAALANGGELVRPHVGERVEYEMGYSRDLHTGSGQQPRAISEKTSDEITRMLVKVVDEALKNGEVKLDRYSVAAKTGTAQVAKADSPGYYENTFNHSFFGYFPAYDPEYLVFLMNIRPEGAKYASQTLTTPFMDIVRFLINYHQIPPDRQQPTTAETDITPDSDEE